MTTDYYDRAELVLGNGAGGFAAALHYTTGGSPTFAVTADFNRDGKPDFAATTQGANSAVVFLNQSACTAHCATMTNDGTIAGFSTPIAAAAADLNHNGKLDVAVANYTGSSVIVYFDHGPSSYSTTYPVGTFPDAVAIADTNRDGRPDIIAANETGQNISVLVANGNGFDPKLDSALGKRPSGIVTGDFNRDGIPDLAVASGLSNDVTIMWGAGNGLFGINNSFAAAGTSSINLASGDFNRDGKADLVVVHATPQGTISTFFGNGDYTFTAGTSYPVGSTPEFVAVGDFNRDGKDDLAVANYNSGSVSILIGSGTGTFAAAVEYPTGGNPRTLAVADFNGDGKLDLAVGGNSTPVLELMLGNGLGAFSAQGDLGGTTQHRAIVAADFNGDGKPDLAVAAGDTLRMVKNTCPVADLTIAKTHSSDFTQGGYGIYNITVTNSGTGTSNGVVTVTDPMPPGFQIAGIYATTWSSCIASNNATLLTCTRNTALSAGSSFGDIAVTVRVPSNAPAQVTNTATVSSDDELETSNNSASDPTTVLRDTTTAPTRLVATAVAPQQVDLTWDPVDGAQSYTVYRSANITLPYVGYASIFAPNYTDTEISANSSYLYWVVAVRPNQSESASSNLDVATTTMFTDDPLTAGTLIKALHMQELRSVAGSMLQLAGMGRHRFTTFINPGTAIAASHLNEVRSLIGQARDAIGIQTAPYTTSNLAGAPVKAIDLQETRANVK